MYAIVSNIKREIDFAEKVKKYLDDLCLIKEDGFSGDYSNSTYYFTCKNDLRDITVAVSFGDAYNYVLRKHNVNTNMIGTDIEEYILRLVQEELSDKIS